MSARIPRFFVADRLAGVEVDLDEAETHHAVRVLRLSPGARIELFDGFGNYCAAEIAKVTRRRMTCQLIEAPREESDRPPAIALAVSLPKGDRQRMLIEKLTELGVAKLIPLIAARGVAQPTPAVRQRLLGQVIAACKQCGRNRLMEIAEPAEFADMVTTTHAETASRWIADTMTRDRAWPALLGESLVALVGPEGGWTDDERRLAVDHFWSPVSLGPHVLRVETAAVALAAAMRLTWRPTS